MSEGLEHKVGELTGRVDTLIAAIEADRRERNERHKEVRERMNDHSRRIRIQERFRNMTAGVLAAVGAIFGFKHWPWFGG